QRFLDVADRKKEVYDEDLVALVSGAAREAEEVYQLDYFHILSGNSLLPTATITLKKGDEVLREAAVGDGPVDAAYKAIDRMVDLPVSLEEYSLRAVTGGQDAMGNVVVRLKYQDAIYLGRGVSTDVIEASIRAYLHALNRIQSVIQPR
ncbi:MAG TPA: alpha-isopropylmalate synthase regulatory domain-containing protein, partial [bacterium]|nr:alpha-isopropylmalate synthase regulatory domain-containing protein [bacterium]